MSACQAANVQYTNDMHPQKRAMHISMFILTATYSFKCMIALPLYSNIQYVTIDSEVPIYSYIEATCSWAARDMHVLYEHL